jgi:hypothetical protein
LKKIDTPLKVALTELGSMVELAVVPPDCAATKLAKSATATVDFANMANLRVDDLLD